MTDYISRKAALEAVCFNCSERNICGGSCDDTDRIKAIPAADVRPVVRCRDCKCYRQSNFVDKHMECARSGFSVHSVDFCSFADKRGVDDGT